MLIDDVIINVKAGKGGDGVVRFSRTKQTQGPTGGNGGKGGNVILEGVSDLGVLRTFRSVKNIKAKNGNDGEQKTKDGKDGNDVIIKVPVGTIVHEMKVIKQKKPLWSKVLINKKIGGKKIEALKTFKKLNILKKQEEPKQEVEFVTVSDPKDLQSFEITKIGQRKIIARGGNGGFGNFYFRSSRHTTPDRANLGMYGEEKEIHLVLKLIADIGFVGYPNVGKSSLLNELTNASSKVANYKFTTLEPHLGVYFEAVLADLPGLLEGAADGVGLGYKFLRHIERTHVLFHFVAADSANPTDDYKKIRKELGKYNPLLLEKPEWIIISKSDEVEGKELEKIKKKLEKYNKNTITLSILKEESLKNIKKIITEIIKDK